MSPAAWALALGLAADPQASAQALSQVAARTQNTAEQLSAQLQARTPMPPAALMGHCETAARGPLHTERLAWCLAGRAEALTVRLPPARVR